MEFESVLKLRHERQVKVADEVRDLIMCFPARENVFVLGATYNLPGKGMERPIPGRGWFNTPPLFILWTDLNIPLSTSICFQFGSSRVLSLRYIRHCTLNQMGGGQLFRRGLREILVTTMLEYTI